MAKYHSVKKAAEVTGKSESTIKRLLTSIKNDPDTPDRRHLLPTVDQYQRHKEDGTPFVWEISETLLQQRYPDSFIADVKEKGSGSLPSAEDLRTLNNNQLVGALNRTIDTLSNQLTAKDTQLANKDEQLNSQNELIEKLGGMAEALQKEMLLLKPGVPATENIPVDDNPEPVVVTPFPNAKPQTHDAGFEQPKKGTGVQDSPPKQANRKTSSKKKVRRQEKPKGVFEKHTPTFHGLFSRLTRQK